MTATTDVLGGVGDFGMPAGPTGRRKSPVACIGTSCQVEKHSVNLLAFGTLHAGDCI